MKTPWVTILLIALAVLVTLQMSALLKKNPEPDKELVKQNIALHDSLSAIKFRETTVQVQLLQAEIDKKDQQIEDLLNRKQQIITIREKIPSTVNNYSDPELGAALADYDRTH